MKLALVSPLPPLPCPAAEAALKLIPQLAEAEDVELHLFAHAPEQVAPGFAREFPLHPTANLPHLLRSGKVDIPIYLVDDNDYHAHQQRLLERCPGVEVRVGESEVEPDRILASARRRMSPPPGVIPEDRQWPAVETVTVAYNSRAIIGQCLQALLDQEYDNLTVTVVDNASTDGTADYVRAQHPKVNLITSDKNLGFAGGNNLAFAKTQAEYVVLMNQDAIPRRDCIRELVQVAEQDPVIASVGAKMLMRRCPTVINSTGIRINQGGFAVDRQIGEKDTDPSPKPVEVFGVCGGAQLIRTDALRELGGFDEAFFMYFEDVDLCWRLRLAGKRILHAPLAVVHHDWHGDLEQQNGDTTGDVDARTLRRRYLCERNRLQCLFKNYELSSLRGVLPRLRRFEKTRLASCDAAIRRGETSGYFRMVKKAIRGAWRWTWLHLPGLWWRRRKVQCRRQQTDAEVQRFIEDGVTEPSHVGDLEIIQDRFSARPESRIEMGKNDQHSLGPGWYGAEPVAGQDLGINTRWSKAEAWFYLRPTEDARTLHLRVAAGPRPTDYRVSCGTIDLGGGSVEDDQLRAVAFELPEPIPAGSLVELRIACGTFNPKAAGLGEDTRDLGIRVAEAWLA